LGVLVSIFGRCWSREVIEVCYYIPVHREIYCLILLYHESRALSLE